MKDWLINFSTCLLCTAFAIIYLGYRLRDIANRLLEKLSNIEQQIINQRQPQKSDAVSKPSGGDSGKTASETASESGKSLLNDKHWVQLIENVFFLQDCVNEEAARAGFSQEQNDFIDYINSKFEELYQYNGLSPIQDEKCFDWERHKPADSQCPLTDDAIEKTIVLGWQYKNRVFKRAIVSTINDNKEKNDD